jgi:hypothetical protein
MGALMVTIPQAMQDTLTFLLQFSACFFVSPIVNEAWQSEHFTFILAIYF